MKKLKLFAVILAVILGCVAIGLIITAFIGKEDNPHLIFQGEVGKVNLKEERKSTFCVGVSASIADIYPYTHDDETDAVLRKLVYEPLISINNDCKISYCNAKSVTFEKEGREAVVKLNQDKIFSDGEQLDADIVIKSYKWFMANHTAYTNLLSRIVDIRAAGNDSLVFTFTGTDSDNIKIFNIPVISQSDKKGGTALGTGVYCIDSVKPYKQIVLKENKSYSGSSEYDTVLIRTVDYSDMNKLLKSQKFDMFVFNQKEQADAVKADKAYDIYEFGKDTGWFIKHNMDSEVSGGAIAKLIEGKQFFDKTQADGIYSPGVVSAYIEPNYYSMLSDASFKNTKAVSVAHDYTAAATGIYQSLEKKLKDKKVKCIEKTYGIEEVPENFEEDLLLFYGVYKDGMTRADNIKFFKENEEIEAVDYYELLEKYFASKNNITPISKDTVWVAFLAGRDTLGLMK
ncbi:MAG: hypothetical protein HFG29_05115 [Eubacterium sp.]|nr:hypothetical protein [Eubacterium sp.]